MLRAAVPHHQSSRASRPRRDVAIATLWAALSIGWLAPAAASEPSADADIGPPPSARELSWDLMAGGIPSAGAIAEARTGFSNLLAAAYHVSISPQLSIGGLVAVDYAYYAPVRTWDSGLIFAVPVRYALVRSGTFSVGARAEPGLLFQLDAPFRFGVQAAAGISAGWTLENRFIVGIGADVPLAFVIPDEGPVNLTLPILVGPIAEAHLSPPLAVTLDAKMGPHLNTAGGTEFGLRLLFGVAYRL